jgi:flagellar biosynthesis/type III secretory pathway protein FliH
MASSFKLIKDIDAGVESLRAFSVRDIEEERRRIMDAAERDGADVRRLAQEILDQAKTMLARVHEQAGAIMAEAEKSGYEKGHAEGLAAGREEGKIAAYETEARRVREQTAPLAGRLADIAGAIDSQRNACLTGAHRDLLKCAIAVAKKIVKREVSLADGAIKNNLTKAIELSAEKSEIRVRLNPSDAETIEEYVPQMKSAFSKLKGIHLVPDMNVSQGGCVVQSRGGEVDARVETQFEEIERQLMEA